MRGGKVRGGGGFVGTKAVVMEVWVRIAPKWVMGMCDASEKVCAWIWVVFIFVGLEQIVEFGHLVWKLMGWVFGLGDPVGFYDCGNTLLGQRRWA